MKPIPEYLYKTLRDCGDLATEDFVVDDGSEMSFVYFDADGRDFYRVSVEKATVGAAS